MAMTKVAGYQRSHLPHVKKVHQHKKIYTLYPPQTEGENLYCELIKFYGHEILCFDDEGHVRGHLNS